MPFPLRFHVLLLPIVPWAEFRSRVVVHMVMPLVLATLSRRLLLR